MRRIFVTTDAVGGIWQYSLDLAWGFADLGWDVVLAVMGPEPSSSQANDARGIPGARLVVSGLPLDWTAPDREAVQAASERLRVLVSHTGCNSVHLHAPALVGEADWPVPVVAVAHSDVATWWRAVHPGPMPADLEWRAALTGTGLRAADRVIAASHAQAEELERAYGFAGAVVVYNGRMPARQPAGRRERTVLAAGRLWDECKGLAVLDAAADGLGSPVLAAGPLLGPNGAVTTLRHIEHLGTLDATGMDVAMRRACVFCAPALYEPFGLAVLEAAQSGCALVLSDIPTFKELWDGAARFVPARDPASLRAALNEALDDPAPLADAAHSRSGRYSVAAMIAGTADIHQTLLGERP